MNCLQKTVVLIIAQCLLIGQVAARNIQDKIITNSPTFVNQHPDLMYRLRGLDNYKNLRYAEAFTNFKRAAKYADKPSQGMMAEMLWKGEGVTANKIEAYAWIDIAAERGYPTMIMSREKMWLMLDAAQRQQAIVVGLELYKYYGDDVAKKRLENVLRREKNRITGSHAGYVGYVDVYIDTPTGQEKIDAEFYYQDKFWVPDQYWQWQDKAWKDPAAGKVKIGPIDTQPDVEKKQ